jgi:CheY-like chemotaxis protein
MPPPLPVLVVDDHADTADSTALMLRLHGFAVDCARDGCAALEAVRRDAPDVVLLDIGLPGLDGYEVARRLRREPARKRPLLIAVTGYDQPRDRERSREAGIDLHLAKPVDPDALDAILKRFERALHG